MAGKKNKTILVVDDEQDIRSTVKTILETAGYNVVLAVSGDDCLKKLSGGTKPDLILMDIMMPGTPTREVVRKIKVFKIVYFSVVKKSDAEKEGMLRQKNIIGFIPKPFDINELVEQIKELVG